MRLPYLYGKKNMVCSWLQCHLFLFGYLFTLLIRISNGYFRFLRSCRNTVYSQEVFNFRQIDPWWNVSAENQASDRAYRIGQNSRVQVYKLIMRNTVEERIQHLQQMKKELADIFVEENETNIMRMDKDQILELLKVNG